MISQLRRPEAALVGAVVLLCVSILAVSSRLDLGDAEALYAAYAAHPSLSYVDHPPLIGVLIRLSTGLFGESVLSVRSVPMLCAAFSLLFAFLSTKEMFGSRAAACCVGLMMASPVFSIGMTAASPDAPLAAAVTGFLYVFQRGVNDAQRSPTEQLYLPILAGCALGISFLAKYTGACLTAGALLVLLLPENRTLLRRPGFFIGAAVALSATIPVLLWNMRHSWVGVLHRLVYTQQEAGFSFRNIGALLGGQLLYVGPLVLVLFGIAVHRCGTQWNSPSPRRRFERLLCTLSAAVLLPTYLLVSWSKAAEPHWPAAGYLPLFPLAAGAIAEGTKRLRKLFHWALGIGVATLVIAHIAVQSPAVMLLTPRDRYEPKYDLANELRGFPEVADAIRRINPTRRPVTAAFYTLCSQLAFHLNRPDDPPVRCVSPSLDDFDIWYGPFSLDARGTLFVTDSRFDHDPAVLFPKGRIAETETVSIFRAGTEVRQFVLSTIRPQRENAKTDGEQTGFASRRGESRFQPPGGAPPADALPVERSHPREMHRESEDDRNASPR